MRGASRSYGIVSVDPGAQVITLDRPYEGQTKAFETYLIRSSVADRKGVQWCEADHPEAWPPWNTLSVPEDGDEITGLYAQGSYLYVVERRHTYQVQYSDGPESGGHAFLVSFRGAINHRLIVVVEESAFLMDEAGIYRYQGGIVHPISEDIQVMFDSDGMASTYQLDRNSDTTLWHASLDPVKTTIRWFVAFTGQVPLQHCIAFNYRTERFWVESYPTMITSSCTGTLAAVPNPGIPSGHRRALAGTEARTVLVLGEGSLDLASDQGTLEEAKRPLRLQSP